MFNFAVALPVAVYTVMIMNEKVVEMQYMNKFHLIGGFVDVEQRLD